MLRTLLKQSPPYFSVNALKKCHHCQFHALATPLFKSNKGNNNSDSDKANQPSATKDSIQNHIEEQKEIFNNNVERGHDDINTFGSGEQQQITPRKRDSSAWSKNSSNQQQYSKSSKIEK